MLDLSNDSTTSKPRKRPRQSNLVFVLELVSAVAGAGAVITGAMYLIGRFCWWAVPGSTGSGRRSCGNLAQYSYQRLNDPTFVPLEIVSKGEWAAILFAIAVGFGSIAFIIDRIQRGSK